MTNVIPFNQLASNSDKFFHELERKTHGAGNWDDMDNEDRSELLAMYHDVEPDLFRKALNKHMYVDELINELLEFAHAVHHMSLSRMHHIDAAIIEKIQKSIMDVFNRPVGDVIDSKINYVLGYEERLHRSAKSIDDRIQDLGHAL